MAGDKLTDTRSDDELVSACNDGDSAQATRAFETLYARHKDYVLRVALRYVDDRDLALDALQETFAYLLRKFPPTGSGLTLTAQLTSLLYPVAKNNAISQQRKAARYSGIDGPDPDELEAPLERDSSAVATLLTDLSAEHREITLLRFVDGLSLQDIAAALDIPLGTVKSRLHLAIKQLRNSPQTKKFFDS